MTEDERMTIIEWLYVLTGTHRSFWQRYNDDTLERLYEKNVESSNSQAVYPTI